MLIICLENVARWLTNNVAPLSSCVYTISLIHMKLKIYAEPTNASTHTLISGCMQYEIISDDEFALFPKSGMEFRMETGVIQLVCNNPKAAKQKLMS